MSAWPSSGPDPSPETGPEPGDLLAVERALALIRDAPEPVPEYRWLFLLAGALRGVRTGVRAGDAEALILAGRAAGEFARRIVREGRGSGAYIDWGDEAAVALEFAAAWARRRHVLGSDYLARAVALSAADPLRLTPETNAWTARVTNMGFILQELQPDRPFLIPVSAATAGRLGTSLRTLSLAVNAALAARFLRIEGTPPETPGGRFARRLRFNPRHPHLRSRLAGARATLAGGLTSWREDAFAGRKLM